MHIDLTIQNHHRLPFQPLTDVYFTILLRTYKQSCKLQPICTFMQLSLGIVWGDSALSVFQFFFFSSVNVVVSGTLSNVDCSPVL